ncbi:MAG: hypothetical protein MUC59_19390, partial [Saprospiraceae bacterium]|nr:hypothetical protein [Saprospiraceae bacterium]
MEIRQYSSAFFCLLLLLATFSSCKKEDIDNGDQGFPLTLTAEKPDRNVLLTWTATKNSDFEAYVVVRSLSPTIDDEAPASGVIETIEDYNTNIFVDKTVPFVEDVYYKVFAKIGGRFLASPTIHVRNDVKLLDMVINRSVFDKENDLAYFFDSAKNSVFKYNYSVGKVVDTLELPGAFDVRMAIGNHGNGNELYIYRSGNFSLDIYNADNLNFITSISTNG